MTATTERLAKRVEARHRVETAAKAVVRGAYAGPSAEASSVPKTEIKELAAALKALDRIELEIADQTNGTLMKGFGS